MRIIISFISGVIVMSLIAFTQKDEKDISLARVQRASGKLVFIRCEPVQNYDVVMEVDPFSWSGNDTPEKLANAIVNACLRKGKKKDIAFDGVIIGSTRKDIAIKFKD